MKINWQNAVNLSAVFSALFSAIASYLSYVSLTDSRKQYTIETISTGCEDVQQSAIQLFNKVTYLKAQFDTATPDDEDKLRVGLAKEAFVVAYGEMLNQLQKFRWKFVIDGDEIFSQVETKATNLFILATAEATKITIEPSATKEFLLAMELFSAFCIAEIKK